MRVNYILTGGGIGSLNAMNSVLSVLLDYSILEMISIYLTIKDIEFDS